MTRYLSFILNVLVFGVVLATTSLTFETNDDVVSFFQTSGYLTGKPDGRLIFSHRWVGEILAWLYGALPGPNWYVWYLYAALVLSNVLITKLLIENNAQAAVISKGKYWKLLPPVAILSATIVWNLLFFCTALLRPQFTIAAMWLGAAGWFWLFCKLPFRDDLEKSLTKSVMSWLRQDKSLFKHFFIGIGALLVSALVRWQAFVGISILLVPVLGYYMKAPMRRFWFGFAGIVGLLLYLNEHLNQQNQPLETSIAYQMAIDAVVNGPNNLDSITIKNKQFTANDLNLLQGWFWVDKTVFSPKKIIHLSEGIRQWRTPNQSLHHLMSSVYYNWPHVLVWLLVGLGLWKYSVKYQRKQVLWVGLWLCLLLGALAMTSRTPFHVLFPFVALLAAAVSIVHKTDWTKLRWPLVILLGTSQMYALYHCHLKNSAYTAAYQRNVTHLKQNSTKLYVVRGAAFPYEGSFSWWYKPQEQLHNLLPTGYLIHTPLYNDILRQWNIDNLAPALLQRNDIQLVDAPMEALQRFYLEKYQLKVDLNLKK